MIVWHLSTFFLHIYMYIIYIHIYFYFFFFTMFFEQKNTKQKTIEGGVLQRMVSSERDPLLLYMGSRLASNFFIYGT